MSASLNALSSFSLWSRCSDYLHEELSAQQYNTWIKPLTVGGADAELAALQDGVLVLQAPNRFIKNWVASKFQSRLSELARLLSGGQINAIRLDVSAEEGSVDPGNQGSFSHGEQSQPSRSQCDTFGNHDKACGIEAESRKNTQSWSEAPAKNTSGLDGFAHTEQVVVKSSDASEAVFPKISFSPERHGLQQMGESRSNHWELQADRLEKSNVEDNFYLEKNYPTSTESFIEKREKKAAASSRQNSILDRYRFDNLVEGKSNQMALAAAKQVVENPSTSYNPLFLYGGVGLGKTHLMHAVGNEIKRRKPNAKVVYLHSERFVGDMVKALQLNAIDDFKRYYRSVDALLIDDIQFFAGKDRSQEEFFHTFNALLEGGHQMIFSCDRYPKSINGIEERLKSRFGWGLTVHIEPPELEMRVAILKHKAEQENIDIPNDAAFFLAQRVRANGRDLEGALKRVYANSQFQNKPVTVELVKESLKDLLALQDKMVTIDNIQRTTAEYYKIKLSDLLSKRRNRSLARPRQMAMSLAKELTRHSLPEIGDAFGGRDHTTVLHACRKIKELRDSTHDVSEDYRNLVRLLST